MNRPHRRAAAALAAALTLALAPAAATPAAAATVHLDPADPAALGRVPGNPDDPALRAAAPPPGVNDPSCVPDPAHPEPVVLLHGTWSNQARWAYLADALRGRGHCVWTTNFGREPVSAMGAPLRPWVHGNGDIRAAAGEVAAFIEEVRAATGAPRVTVVGHSQAGALLKYYVNELGGAGRVSRMVVAAGSQHGTDMRGASALLWSMFGPVPEAAALVTGTAALQQLDRSDFTAELDRLPDTVAPIRYTVLVTADDTTVTPPESGFLEAAPGVDLVNLEVHAACGGVAREIPHDRMTIDPAAVSLLVWGLERGPGEQAPPACAGDWAVDEPDLVDPVPAWDLFGSSGAA